MIEVSAKSSYAFGIELVETAGAGAPVENKARILEDFQVLRDGWATHGKCAGEFMDREWTCGQFLQDCHASGIAKSIKAGLEMNVHSW